MSETPPTGAEWVEAIVKALHLGYLDALDDVQDRLAALGNEPQPKHDGDGYSWSDGFVNAQEQALAAIDALRKP